jgi:hypothetical protein
VCSFTSEPSDGMGTLIVEVVVSFAEFVEGTDGVTHDNLLRAVQDHELAVWSKSRLVLLSDSCELLPEVSVTSRRWLLTFVKNGPGEEIEGLVGHSSVVDGESHK